MPSESEHLTKERDSEAAASLLESGGAIDWAVVATFYRAFHLVEAWFSQTQGVHHDKHVSNDPANDPGTTDAVRQHFPRPVVRDYVGLYQEGRKARYYPYEIDSNRYHQRVIPQYQSVRGHVGQDLGMPS